MRFTAMTLVLAPALALAEPQIVPVVPLASEPAVDGVLDEWPGEWLRIPIDSAVEDDEKNRAGAIEVLLKAGIANGRIYVAARWPDSDASVEYRRWVKRGKKHRRSKTRDDMFALRFHMSGDYDRTMISEKAYRVDVWVWSAGRSNPAGYAEDYSHAITTDVVDDAAEYELPGGATVYITKAKDAGDPIFSYVKPAKDAKEKELPSVVWGAAPSGSMADVKAKGVWSDGTWSLEMGRALDTGHADDVKLSPGQEILGQIAVFDRSNAEHKSVSEPLAFRIGGS
jgi:hypothetical protein